MEDSSDDGGLHMEEPDTKAKALETKVEGAAGSDKKDDKLETKLNKKDPKIWSDIESMVKIVRSPYENNESAEVGEKVFDEIKSLLMSRTEPDGSASVYPAASRLFGTALAESLVAAFHQIGKSGMLYSPAWQDGKIRGVQCGWIPKAMLLLCLHEQRFTKAGEAVLVGIIKDLGTCKIVKDAMKEWGLEVDYLNLACNNFFSFTSKKSACCKCEIFVARAYRCVKALKRSTPDGTLMAKIKACLQIMDDHVRVNKKELQKRKDVLEMEKLQQQQREKSKASKRPRNEQEKSDGEAMLQLEGASEAASLGEFSSDNGGSSKKGSSRGEVKQSNNNKRRRKEREESLTVLVGLFEEQYKQMGETLSVLKKKIQAHKAATALEVREEVRAELLQELIKSGYNGANLPPKT